MGPFPTLAMLALSAVVVLGSLAFVIRFDPGARAERRRFELHVRRGAARLVQDAERAQRAQQG